MYTTLLKYLKSINKQNNIMNIINNTNNDNNEIVNKINEIVLYMRNNRHPWMVEGFEQYLSIYSTLNALF